MVSVQVEVLVGLKGIGAPFGAGESLVRKWFQQGAPIIRDDKGTYRAEKAELWIWMRKYYDNAEGEKQ